MLEPSRHFAEASTRNSDSRKSFANLRSQPQIFLLTLFTEQHAQAQKEGLPQGASSVCLYAMGSDDDPGPILQHVETQPVSRKRSSQRREDTEAELEGKRCLADVSRTTLARAGLACMLPEPLKNETASMARFPSQPAVLPERPPDACVLDHLRRLHPHPNDGHLTVNAAEHAYFWKGERVRRSVTQVIKQFAEEFDADAIIAGMRQGPEWPRPGYLRRQPCTESMRSLQQLQHTVPEAADVLLLMQNSERDEQTACAAIRRLKGRHPQHATSCNALGLSPEEIKEKWEMSRLRCARAGTWMHAQFECLLNGGSSPVTPEVSLFLAFLRTQLPLKAYRTEWAVYASTVQVAGTIDFVGEKPDGKKVLVDWKRSGSIAGKERHFGKFMQPPVDDVPDCAVWQYRLQLNIYRVILEEHYDQQVAAMFVVCTHPDRGCKPWVDIVPLMDRQAKALLSRCSEPAQMPVSSR